MLDSEQKDRIIPMSNQQLRLTQQQLRSVLAVGDARPGDIIAINGPAGSGKTSVIRELVARYPGRVILTASTNKACRVLAARAGVQASTVDSLTRRPLMIENSEQRGVLDPIVTRSTRMVLTSRGKTIAPGKILVVDEASMIGPRLWEVVKDFAASGILVLVGDGFQLAPVAAGRFSVFEQPGVQIITLDTVHRHGGVILETATRIRTAFRDGGPASPRELLGALAPINLWETLEHMRANLSTHSLDFVCLTSTNAARNQITRAYREFAGISHKRSDSGDDIPIREVATGEPLLVISGDDSAGLYKGDLVTFVSYAPDSTEFTTVTNGNTFVTRTSIFRRPDGADVRRDLLISTASGRFDHKDRQALNRHLGRGRGVVECEFGYVLTVHKSQGSQYKSVLIFYDEIFQTSREDKYRSIYTAVTRASDTCAVSMLPRSSITRSSFSPPAPVSAETKALFGKKAA